MEDRNKLFRKVHSLLVREGVNREDARKMVQEELRIDDHHQQFAGGENGRGPEVVLIDDLCEGKHFSEKLKTIEINSTSVIKILNNILIFRTWYSF